MARPLRNIRYTGLKKYADDDKKAYNVRNILLVIISKPALQATITRSISNNHHQL
jgi:hypothetical protein